MKNKKNLAICSLVLSVLSLAPLVVTTKSINSQLILIAVGITLAIIGAVLGFISKEAAKGLATTGIVIGIISFFISLFTLVGVMGIKNATDCVDNGNDTSTCKYMGQDIEVPNSLLSDEQKNK